MSEKQLTFKEFLRLPRAEQNIRYKELSDHDKFLARMNDWGAPDPDPNAPEDWKPSPEVLEKMLKISKGEIKYEPKNKLNP